VFSAMTHANSGRPMSENQVGTRYLIHPSSRWEWLMIGKGRCLHAPNADAGFRLVGDCDDGSGAQSELG
jgi:hypothetical protein